MNISRLLDGSINITTCKNIGLQNQTSEELIASIRANIAELHCRGLIVDSTKFYEHQLTVFKSLEDWHSSENKPFPLICIDSFHFGKTQPLPIISKEEEFAKTAKFIWNGMKEVYHSYIDPLLIEINTQTRIDECEKILRKHPNRTDVRMELMKLKKIVKPKIGRKKKRK